MKDSKVTTHFADGQATVWYLRWLNTKPGNTGLTSAAFATMISYALDGLGDGLRDSGADNAMGPFYGHWYRSIVDHGLWGGAWGDPPSDLAERAAGMLLRDFHAKNPVQFAGIAAASKTWSKAVSDGISGGLPLGEVSRLLRVAAMSKAAASAAGMSEIIKKIDESRVEAVKKAELARLAEAGVETQGESDDSVKIIIGVIIAGLLVAALIYWRRRR